MAALNSPWSHRVRRLAIVLSAWAGSLLIVGCSPSHQPVQLRFISPGADQLTAFMFYVHDIVLMDAEGREHSLHLDTVAPWQSEHVALLDLASARSTAARQIVEGRAPAGAYTGVRFAVGVPFELNHANPLTATPPLDRGEMFWSWQTGYKFLRIDTSAQAHESAFHLGSTGCSSASALRPPRQPCAQPNVMHVELQPFDPSTQVIEVRVDEFIALLMSGSPTACTGDYSSEICARVFSLTGLDTSTGRCESTVCQRQQLFVPGRSP